MTKREEKPKFFPKVTEEKKQKVGENAFRKVQ